tara:strand:+ start:17753 stop:19684 length:1932 start_codon:yes stop_codon:yes gene_type:complete
MVMRSLRNGASGGFFKYILFGILGMSVGGLVMMDVRGVLNGGGGVGGNDVVRIADDTISIQDFNNTLRRSLARYRGITPQQAFKMGLTDEILTGEIRTYFLLNEARELGLSLDKNRIAQRVAEFLKPNVKPGQTMQEALEDMLRYQGMSEFEFVSLMSRETSGDIIMQALRAGFKPDNADLVDDLYQFQQQTRDVDIIMFSDDEITNVEPATDEQLKRLYDSVKKLKYTIPEYRTVKVGVFDPAVIKVDVSVSDDEAQAFYDDNIDDFKVGDQYILTQSLVDDEAQAQKISDAINAGKSIKDAAVAIVGSEGRYFENGAFEKASMLPALRDALENLKVGDVTPPVKTMLGYHIVRLEEIVPATTRTYDEVKKNIVEVITNAKKDEAIYKISEDLDESLDEGVSLEDAAKTVQLSITTVLPVDDKGLGKNAERVLEQFKPADQEEILGLIFELQKGETSMLQELPSGLLASFVLTDVEDEHFKSFEDVKEELATQFIKDQKHDENDLKLKKYLAEIGTGGSSFESIAKENKKKIQSIKGITLSGEMAKPLTDALRPTIFQTHIGAHDILEFDGKLALMKVSNVTLPEIDDAAKESQEAIAKTVNTEAGDEMFLMYLRGLSKKYNVKVNRALLENAYGAKEDESY